MSSHPLIVRKASESNQPPSRTSTKPSSPKTERKENTNRPTSTNGQQINVSSMQRAPSAAAAAASASSSTIPSRPTANGPVKGLYRPPSTSNRAVDPISVPSSNSSRPSSSTSPSTSLPLSNPAKPYVRRPTPEDSDYDSDEVVSEEESEEEQPIIHPPAESIPFQLDEPQWDRLEGDEAPEVVKVDYPSDVRLSLTQSHLLPAGAQLHPHTNVQLEHQSRSIEAASNLLTQSSQALRSDGSKFNQMSFSSSDAPECSNDLLYTDAHAPYTYSRHDRPLTTTSHDWRKSFRDELHGHFKKDPYYSSKKVDWLYSMLKSFDFRCQLEGCGLRFESYGNHMIESHHTDGSSCRYSQYPPPYHDHFNLSLSEEGIRRVVGSTVPMHGVVLDGIGPPYCHRLAHVERWHGSYYEPTNCTMHKDGHCPTHRHHHGDGCIVGNEYRGGQKRDKYRHWTRHCKECLQHWTWKRSVSATHDDDDDDDGDDHKRK